MKILRIALVLTVLALAGATVAFALPSSAKGDHGGPTTSAATTGAGHDMATEEDVADEGDGNHGDVDLKTDEHGGEHAQGGAKNDAIQTHHGDDTVHAGGGNDHVALGAGNDHAYGGKGADDLHGDSGNDELDGDDGDDSLVGGAGNDKLHGGAGNDTLDGGAGNDVESGDAGNDTLTGGPGTDLLIGGAGRDAINAKDGKHDVVQCGAGIDSVKADEVDTLTGCEHIER